MRVAGVLSGRVRSRRAAVADPRRALLAFVATTVVAVVAVALASAVASRVVADREAIDAAVAHTDTAARLAVAPVLTDDVLRGDRAARERLDEMVRAQVLDVSLVRVKIWDSDGRIVYSDEPRLLDERFVLEPEEIGILAGGRPDAEVSDLTAPENRYERPGVGLLEVYHPMRTTGGAPVLFEAYHRYDGVLAAAERIRERFLPVDLGGVLLLALLQIPIALRLVRGLRQSREQQDALRRRHLEAIDDERRRIAGELHDGPVQQLAGVAFALGAAARDGVRGRIDPDRLDDAAEAVRTSVRSLRSLLVEIYPPNLRDEGLAAALGDLAVRIVPPEVHLDIDVDPHLPPIDQATTELLYRAAQEGIRNVVRHAGASRIDVGLRRSERGVALSVADDGGGYHPSSPRPGHLGLQALADLAAAQDADLSVASAPGHGTVLLVDTPVPAGTAP